jgi:glucan phosphorylase
MDEAEQVPKPIQPKPEYPSWISTIDDRQARHNAERLYLENEELQRKHEGNLKFISGLRSKDMVQQERIDRLESKRATVIAALGGGLGVIGLAALLMTNYPTLGIPAAAFLTVLLGRACFPALLHLLKAWARSYAPERF